MKIGRFILALAGLLGSVFVGSLHAGPVLDGVRTNNMVRCGVSSGVVGFSAPNAKGDYQGLDVDVCRAVAAAVLGDAEAVQFKPLSSQQRFVALQSNQIDVLSRNTTWTLMRDAGLGIQFAGVTYYDGQGIMVPARFGVKTVKQLAGAEICVQSGTTNEKNLATFLAANQIKAKTIVYDNFEAAYKAFFKGRCQAFSTDVSALIGLKTKQARNSDAYHILQEVFSKEPLGPAVKAGDLAWFNIVKWVVYGLIEAEELGISSQNIEQALQSENPAWKRVLGRSEDLGKPLGLDKAWLVRVIRQVGNYGEIFDRHLGQGSELKLSRGLNRLWIHGGLMYAPPLR